MAERKRISFWVQSDTFLYFHAAKTVTGHRNWQDFFEEAVRALLEKKGIKLEVRVNKDEVALSTGV